MTYSTPLHMNEARARLVGEVLDKVNIIDLIKRRVRTGKQKFHPFITFSRDPGSGGKPIAQRVAEKLGYEFYDAKLLDEISKSAKMRRQVLEEVDEKERTMIDDWVHNLLNPDYISEAKYINHLCKVTLSIAQHGKAVILGRGSNFITPNAFGLQVRITAPYRVCVARAVEYEHLTNTEARERIRKISAERAAFVKQYFNKDNSKPKYYDLTLNTTYYSIDAASDVVIGAYDHKFPGRILLLGKN